MHTQTHTDIVVCRACPIKLHPVVKKIYGSNALQQAHENTNTQTILHTHIQECTHTCTHTLTDLISIIPFIPSPADAVRRVYHYPCVNFLPSLPTILFIVLQSTSSYFPHAHLPFLCPKHSHGLLTVEQCLTFSLFMCFFVKN